MRVVPDISADADPGTGFLIGLHQTLPDGTSEYTTTRYGGTSLASPLLAGMVADADQAAGGPVGFINPTIYGLDQTDPSSIYDVLPESSLEGNYPRRFRRTDGVGPRDQRIRHVVPRALLLGPRDVLRRHWELRQPSGDPIGSTGL